jgi:hypothetical protein
MGRFIKNVALSAGSHAIQLPLGTNTIGPRFPQNGQIRYNSDVSAMQIYSNGSWIQSAVTGRVSIVKDSFIGTGSQSSFTMSQSYTAGHEADMLVFISNIFQNPGVTFTVNGTTISFTSVPDVNAPIVILHNYNSTSVSYQIE